MLIIITKDILFFYMPALFSIGGAVDNKELSKDEQDIILKYRDLENARQKIRVHELMDNFIIDKEVIEK